MQKNIFEDYFFLWKKRVRSRTENEGFQRASTKTTLAWILENIFSEANRCSRTCSLDRGKRKFVIFLTFCRCHVFLSWLSDPYKHRVFPLHPVKRPAHCVSSCILREIYLFLTRIVHLMFLFPFTNSNSAFYCVYNSPLIMLLFTFLLWHVKNFSLRFFSCNITKTSYIVIIVYSGRFASQLQLSIGSNGESE